MAKRNRTKIGIREKKRIINATWALMVDRLKQIDKKGMDKAFYDALSLVVLNERRDQGIGSLQEKTIHRVLKNYYEADKRQQEIPIEGFYADILRDDGSVVEIQTKSFDRLRPKLEVFLKEHIVTIVYPMVDSRTLCYIDEDTGEILRRRKSPKHMKDEETFVELYRIKSYLSHPNIRIKLVVLECEDYYFESQSASGRSLYLKKFDSMPLGIVREVDLNRVEDYMQFVPLDLEEDFTLKEYSKASGLSHDLAGISLRVLTELGILSRVGKRGNAYLYRVVED